MKQELILNDVWSDWFTNGIFQIIDDLYNVPWESDIDSRLLDMEYYGNRSGTKKIAPLLYYLLDQYGITAENRRTLADLCWKKFNKNWTALWNTLNFEYDPISNYDMVETEGTTAGSTTDANSGIYGFNSQQASPSDTSHSTTNGNENRTLTRKGNIGVTTSQQMIQSERDLWMWKFYEHLFADVDTVLVTAVYGCSNRDYLTVIAQAGYKLPVASDSTLGGVKAVVKTDDMTLAVGVDEDGKLWVQETYIPPVEYPVTSVNGMTGDVNLTSNDVGAPTLDEFQQIEDDVDMHAEEINALALKLPFGFAINGEGKYGYLKADGSFNPFNEGGGGISLPDNVKIGFVTVTENMTSGDLHLTSITELGFTPRIFILSRIYNYASTQSEVIMSSYVRNYASGTNYYRRESVRNSSGINISSNTNNWTSKSNGFLNLIDNDEIAYSPSANLFLSPSTYMWTAIDVYV